MTDFRGVGPGSSQFAGVTPIRQRNAASVAGPSGASTASPLYNGVKTDAFTPTSFGNAAPSTFNTADLVASVGKMDPQFAAKQLHPSTVFGLKQLF